MPAPARKAARAASRAAPVWWPEPDRMSAAPRAYLWLAAFGRGSASPQTAGALTKVFGAMGPSAASGMPMSASRIAPASVRPGSRRWPGFEPKEGHARAGFDRDAANLAGFPVDSGGNVDREHAAPCPPEGVDPLDDRLRFAVDVARKTGAEQGVDHAIGSGKGDCGGGEDRALIAAGGERRVAFQGVAAAEQAQFDRIAALR